MTQDQQLHKHIEDLVAEEHRLLEKADDGGFLTPAERTRLDELSVALDRYWDLLRQRRARRDAGQDPNLAHMRPANVVEKYRQ